MGIVVQVIILELVIQITSLNAAPIGKIELSCKYCHTPIRRPNFKKRSMSHVGEEVRSWNTRTLLVGMEHGTTTLEHNVSAT